MVWCQKSDGVKMLPEKTKLVLGRGEVYFDRFLGTSSEGERYIGNTPTFRIEREITRLERSRSYRGQKQKRKSIVIQETVSMSMTTDDISSENTALWNGVAGDATNVGVDLVPYSETFLVKKDRYYKLGLSEIGGGFSFVDNAEVRLGNISGPILAQNLHYVLERSDGRLFIPDTSPLADGTSIFVRYFKRRNSVRHMSPLEEEVYGALRYISRNPYGPQSEYYFPQVRVTPRGAVDLKGDEFRQMSYDIEAIRLTPDKALMYLTVDNSPPKPITADTMLLRADTTLYTADIGDWEN